MLHPGRGVVVNAFGVSQYATFLQSGPTLLSTDYAVRIILPIQGSMPSTPRTTRSIRVLSGSPFCARSPLAIA